jgi:tetratricopeptide (TPR) repeat protein
LAVPRVLIIQQVYKGLPEGAAELNLAADLAGQIAKFARVMPIVWGESDAVFRSYVEDGTIKRPSENPDTNEIRDAAKAINAKYIIVIQAMRQDGIAYPKAWLYKDGSRRVAWSYGPDKQSSAQSMVIKIDGFVDWTSTIESVAKTWAEMLDIEAFQSHPIDPNLKPPTEVIGGQPGEEAPVPVVDATAGAEALAEAEKFVSSGRADMAILVLRDAVDADPYEPKRRLRLAELLSQQGLPELAASEARRGAEMMPDSPELWLVAAKAELLAGNSDQAHEDVNQALARGADGPLARRLIGDIHLMSGELDKAAVAYEASLAESDDKINKAGMENDADRANGYAFAIQLFDQASDSAAEDLKDLIPSIRLGNDMPALQERAKHLLRRSKAMASMLSLLTPPKRHARSHEQRDLAQKLLAQSAAEVAAYSQSRSNVMATDAAISLGEAVYALKAVRQLHKLERLYGDVNAEGSDKDDERSGGGGNMDQLDSHPRNGSRLPAPSV